MSIHSCFVTSVSSMLKFETIYLLFLKFLTFFFLYFLFKMISAMNETYFHYKINGLWVIPYRNSCSQRYYKIGVLKNFTNIENFIFTTSVCRIIIKETPAHAFSCASYKILRRRFF